MRREAPDPRFYSEVRDLNLEFLRLVRDGRRGSRPVFGLDSAVADQIGRLTNGQLECIAGAPLLLAAIGPVAESFRRRSMISEPSIESDTHWQEASRIFLASLLTYVWQIARRDPLLAGLCAGHSSDWSASLREASFRELRQICDSRQNELQARFHAHPRFWPDLVSAARAGDLQRVHLARMSGIQLALNTGDAAAASDNALHSSERPLPRSAAITR